MTKEEQEIIDGIQASEKLDLLSSVYTKLMALTENPLGNSSKNFIKNPILIAGIQNLINEYASIEAMVNDNTPHYFMILWLRIESYLADKHHDASQEKLNLVEDALKQCLKHHTPEAKSHGTAILPVQIANQKFMREVYSLNDEHLCELF